MSVGLLSCCSSIKSFMFQNVSCKSTKMPSVILLKANSFFYPGVNICVFHQPLLSFVVLELLPLIIKPGNYPGLGLIVEEKLKQLVKEHGVSAEKVRDALGNALAHH